ncbi:MAG: peptidyl-prolyl cis-trans isomerase [Desulfovibrio sp.]|nr:peptidyl-prolyl cis-trans isomerase [Desulfovibrio sp.]
MQHALICLAVFLFLLPVCGLAAPSDDMTVNKIAAVVNGEMVTLHELRMLTMVELARQRLNPDSPKAGEVQKQVLDGLINDLLMRQDAKRYKVTVSDAEVDEELERTLKRTGLTRRQLEESLKKERATLAMYKERISNNLLRQRMAGYMVMRKVFVTPEEVSAYYAKHKDEFAGEKTVDFSLLMLQDGANVQDIYQKIKSGAMSFEDAARRHSADASSQNGGRMEGVIFERLPPEMKKLLSGLKDGQMSPILRIRGGYVVIKRERINEARALTFEEARPRIEEILKAPLLEERFKEYIGQLRGKSVIDIRI